MPTPADQGGRNPEKRLFATLLGWWLVVASNWRLVGFFRVHVDTAARFSFFPQFSTANIGALQQANRLETNRPGDLID